MQVIGLCRFSYPAIGGFQIEHETVQVRRDYLYDPARLEQRFRLFEATALPGFRNQSDGDFELLVVVGDCLPKPSLDRLHDLTADIRQIRIVAQAPDQHRKVLKQLLNAARKDPDQPCLQFRHDDDDAISVNFVERLRAAAQDVQGLTRRSQTVGIDFNNGYLARFGPDGIYAKPVFQPLLGVALGLYVSGGSKQTIFSFAHNKIGRFMPVISQPDEPMWVRTLNDFNDSRQARENAAQLPPLSVNLQQEFLARFAIDPDIVRRVHSAS